MPNHTLPDVFPYVFPDAVIETSLGHKGYFSSPSASLHRAVAF